MYAIGSKRLYSYLLIAGIALAMPALANAATINVPADFGTIQGAINAASPGDTVLVANGTYNETININVNNLKVLSVNGRDSTTIEDNPGAGNPIVTISAPGASFGAGGQGFTVEHQNANATDLLYIDSDQVGFPNFVDPNPLNIVGNRFLGNQVSHGIYSDAALAGLTVNINGNIWGSSGGAYAFSTAMYFDDSNVGSVTNAVLYTTDLNILNNITYAIDDESIYFNNSAYSSTIVIDGNDLNGVPGGTGDGFYCSDYLYDFTTMWFTNNEVSEVDDGFYMYEVENGSTLHVDNNTITDFNDHGVYVEYLYYGSDLTVNDNTIVGDGTADYGVRVYQYDEGCTGQINRNNISMVDYAPIYQEYVYYSMAEVNENTIVGNSSDYGIYHYYCEAALFTMSGNNVSGYDDYGLYVDDYLEAGGVYTFSGNTFTGDGTGDGMYFSDYFEYGPRVLINNNTITEFDSYGIYIYELYEGGECFVRDNDIKAAAGTSATGIYWEYIEDGGGTGEISGNTIKMNGSSADGIYFYYLNYGADLLVANNIVSGFQNYGLYFDDYIEYGATCIIDGNTFTPDSSTGCYAGIYLSDYIEYGSHCVISNNVISDFTDYGIYAYYAYEGSTLNVDGNEVTSRADQTGGYGIYVEYNEYGGDTWITNNTVDMNNSDYSAIYLYYVAYGSNVTITGNDCSGYLEAGLYVDDYVEYGSDLIVTNNLFTAAVANPSTYGVFLDDYVYEGSLFVCQDNTITNFTDMGVRTYYIEYGSDLNCDGNIITGHEDGADYGIYMDSEIEYGNFFSSINGNTISNIRDDGGNMFGIYIYELYEGAFIDVHNNTIMAHPDGASDGIHVDYHEYGSILDFVNNDISGFTRSCMYFEDDITYGAILNIRDSILSGSGYSIHFEAYINDGCIVNIEDNIIEGFLVDGVYFDDYIYASQINIDRNQITGGGTTSGIRLADDLDQGSELLINHNCFSNVPDGIIVDEILETAIAIFRGNDFSAVSDNAIENVNSDADHPIDAEENFLGGAGTSGFVDVTPDLASPPDLDGDGVPNCDDLCPGTAAGVAVDADGCPLPVVDPGPGNGNGNDNGNGNGNGNDNGDGPGDQPTPDACGCGNGGMMLMPLAAIGFAGMRRRVRRNRKVRA